MGEVTSLSEKDELTSTLIDVLLKAKDDFNTRIEFGIPPPSAARHCLEKKYPEMQKTPNQVLLACVAQWRACMVVAETLALS